MIYQCWKGIQKLQIYEMTPIGLHLCDGMHYSCIWTLMNKLQNEHYPWPHMCIELGLTCCDHDGNNEKHQRYIPWPHTCIELRIISSTDSGSIKWLTLRSTSLSTANQIEIAHLFTWWVHTLCICTFRSKNWSQKNFASLDQSGKRFTRGLGTSHHFLRMPWQTAQKS